MSVQLLCFIVWIIIDNRIDEWLFDEKATGGGAYKDADLFKEKLGISLDKEDEMDCLLEAYQYLLISDQVSRNIQRSGKEYDRRDLEQSWYMGRLVSVEFPE